MKFVLANQRTPCGDRTCAKCARSLGPAYLRDVVTRRGFCGYNCYRRYHSTLPLLTTWPTIDTRNAGSLGLAALLIAASCWFQAGAAVAGAWIDTAPAGQRGVHR